MVQDVNVVSAPIVAKERALPQVQQARPLKF
jgi:hypothetical protein